MSNQSPKRTFICECINFAIVTGDTVSLEFNWPGPAPMAGQFFLIKPKRSGVFLARPFSVAGWIPRKNTVFKGSVDRRTSGDGNAWDDMRRLESDRRVDTGGILSFFVARRGKGSRELSEMRKGEEAELSGPLGNCWPLEQIPRGAVALVGGGIGISPLLLLAMEIKKRPFDFFAGFKTRPFGLESLENRAGGPRSIIIATEDGSEGVKGRILDFFTPMGYSGVFACGPEPMLKEVADKSVAFGIPCFISTERHMACGVGACLGCKIKTLGGNRRCCTDGPIFSGEEICFENKGT
jgi:dihydroorotate dehydrogenase electron transfer subunit